MAFRPQPYLQKAITNPTQQPPVGSDESPNFPPPAYHHPPLPSQIASAFQVTDDDDEDSETMSSITLSIAMPITVRGSGNMIVVDPSQASAQIATSVVRSLREASMSNYGIPMIDENGRPRTIDVKIDASVNIEGQRNLVGDRVVATSEPLNPDAIKPTTELKAVTIGPDRRARASSAPPSSSRYSPY